MTLLPVEQGRVSVPDQDGWPDEGDSPRCCNPTCPAVGTQTHHVVRRSETAGPKRWVAIDGVVLLNEHRICTFCHDKINNHTAWIRYEEGTGWVWWASAKSLIPSTATVILKHPKSGRLFARVGPINMGAAWTNQA